MSGVIRGPVPANAIPPEAEDQRQIDPLPSPETEPLRLIIGPMEPRDIQSVSSIGRLYRSDFFSSVDLLEFLRNERLFSMTATIEDMVVGFALGTQSISEGMGVIAVAVHPSERRKRVGSSLIEAIQSRAKMHVHLYPKITVRVRETSLSSQLFFQSLGFAVVEVIHAAFADTGEDGYLMQWNKLPTRKDAVKLCLHCGHDRCRCAEGVAA